VGDTACNNLHVTSLDVWF